MSKKTIMIIAYVSVVVLAMYLMVVSLGGCAEEAQINAPQQDSPSSPDSPSVEAPKAPECPVQKRSGGHGSSKSKLIRQLQEQIAALQAQNTQLNLDLETLNSALEECENQEDPVCPEPSSCDDCDCDSDHDNNGDNGNGDNNHSQGDEHKNEEHGHMQGD